MAGSNLWIFKRVAAGVRQLQNRDKVFAGAEFLLVRLAAGLEQLSQALCRTRVNSKLAWIGSAFRNHCTGFRPNQLGSARAEPAVAAERQLARIAVGVAVTTFHRMDRETVPDSPDISSQASDFNRPRQNPANLLAIFNQRKLDA